MYNKVENRPRTKGIPGGQERFDPDESHILNDVFPAGETGY